MTNFRRYGDAHEQIAALVSDLASVPDLDALDVGQLAALEERFLQLAGPNVRWAMKEAAAIGYQFAPNLWDELVDSVGDFVSSYDSDEICGGILERPEDLHAEFWPFRTMFCGVPGIARRLMAGNWDIVAEAAARHVRDLGPDKPVDWMGMEFKAPENPWPEARNALKQRFRPLGKERSTELFAFGGFHQEARELAYWIQKGGRLGLGVVPPDHYRTHWELKLLDGSVKLSVRERRFQLTQPSLFEVVTTDPFVFGLCRRCDRVFIRSGLGRRAEFCSRQCKDAAAPSTSQRAEYMREYRKRRGQQELKRAERVLKGVPRSRSYEVLSKEFRSKSRGQVNTILRRLGRGSDRKRGETT